jgi:hypothetical protein
MRKEHRMVTSRHQQHWIIAALVSTLVVSYALFQAPQSYAVEAQSCTPGSPAVCVRLDNLEKSSTSISRYAVANLGLATGTFMHTFYTPRGAVVAAVPDEIQPKMTKRYVLDSMEQLPDTFYGYVIISSDQPFAADTLQPIVPITPTPTSPPKIYLPVALVPSPYIVSSSGVVLASGTVEVVGEVTNPGSSAVCFARVAVRFYDAANQLVATEDGSTYLTATLPGDRNPFKVTLSSAPATIKYYRPSLSWSNCYSTYRALTVLSQNLRNRPDPEVFGEIRNDTSSTVKNIDVGVTYYDTNGVVVYTDWDWPTPSELSPGATAIYSARTFVTGISFASFTVRAQGYVSTASTQAVPPHTAPARGASDTVLRVIGEGVPSQP